MTDGVLLFFVGAVGVVVIARLFAALWPTALPHISALARILFLAAVLIVTAALAWLAWEAFKQTFSFGDWTFVYWITLGNGAALLVGCLAGFLMAASIEAIARWNPDANNTWTVAALAAGPGIAMVALFILAVPGIRQSLGLTSVKAGGFEIELSPPTSSPPNVNSLTLPQPNVPGLEGYTPWFRLLWPMFVDLKYQTGKNFVDQGYFVREANYLHAINRSTCR